MKIERINETTIKFILTESELESRGFEDEEIWYDREKGEKLFIDMLEEAYHRENFEVDGPLWVEAIPNDNGVEIIVTKGQRNTSMKISQIDLDRPAFELIDKGGNQDMMNHEMYPSQLEKNELITDRLISQKKASVHSSLYKFRDIENIISFAHRLALPFYNTKLIAYDNYYYLVIHYPEQRIRGKEWVESLILEYGERSNISIYRLEEYGKAILEQNAIAHLIQHFAPLYT